MQWPHPGAALTDALRSVLGMHALKTGDVSGQTCRVFTMAHGDWYLEVGLKPQVANEGDHRIDIIDALVHLRWEPSAHVEMRERQWFSVGADHKVEGGYSLTGKSLRPGSRLFTDHAWFQSNTFGVLSGAPRPGSKVQGTLILQASEGSRPTKQAFSVVVQQGIVSDEG